MPTQRLNLEITGTFIKGSLLNLKERDMVFSFNISSQVDLKNYKASKIGFALSSGLLTLLNAKNLNSNILILLKLHTIQTHIMAIHLKYLEEWVICLPITLLLL